MIGTWISDKPGLAAVKVIVSRSGERANPIDSFSKQFLVGWMELLKPTVTGGGDVYAGDFCQRPQSTR